MLPPFDDYGYLPPGIHACSVDELVARFGSGSKERDAETSELVRFIEAAKAAGVRRLLVNGSFVTGKLAPNDVDVVILPAAAGRGPILGNDELIWPFLQMFVATDDDDFVEWATRDFGSDRRHRPKGVVEIKLWANS